MWRFERIEIVDKAVAWCVEHKVEIDSLGIVVALDELGLLKDPAVEHCVHPTLESGGEIPAAVDKSDNASPAKSG